MPSEAHQTVADLLNWQESSDLMKIPAESPWDSWNQSLMSAMLYALCKGQRPVESLAAHDSAPRPRDIMFLFRDGSKGYFDHNMDSWSVDTRSRYVPFRSILPVVPSPEFAARLTAEHAI